GGEIQQTAGTATWWREWCRTRGIRRIHRSLRRLDKQPTEKNTSDRRILRPWNFATEPLCLRLVRDRSCELDNRRSGQNVPLGPQQMSASRSLEGGNDDERCRGAVMIKPAFGAASLTLDQPRARIVS